jgi:hypothetical protein
MEDWGTEPDFVEQHTDVVAPPPVAGPKQWSWDTQTMLWVAGGVTAVAFVAWFLWSLTSSRAKALAEGASDGNAAS